MPKYQIWVLKNIVPYVGFIIALIVAPKQVKTRYKEIKNKIYIMELVNDADRLLKLESNEDLPSALKKAYSQNSFGSLWLVEGASLYLNFQKRKQSQNNNLNIPQGLSKESLMMVHAGLGLALAKYWLEQPKRQSSSFDAAIENFIAQARQFSHKGYKECTLESLGLVSMILHGAKTVKQIDGYLINNHKELRPLFWNGVGRATYFYPTNFLPTKNILSRPFNKLERLANDKISRMNMAGGIFAAFILVNMRSPAVYEELLNNKMLQDAWNDVLKNRMAGAPLVRVGSSTSGEELIRKIVAFRSDSESTDSKWQDVVSKPYLAGLEVIYPHLLKNKQLGSVFSFSTFEEARKTTGVRL